MTDQKKSKPRPWHLANTTIRTPFRLKGGLEALVAGGFEGNMDKTREADIAHALNDAGVIALDKDTVDITSIARKWRGALIKLGFLWPKMTMAKIKDIDQSKIGKPFTLTPNGRRLLTARSLQGEQEVLLRSIAALRLPSPLERGYDFPQFSPLKHTICILNALLSAGYEPYISRLEGASIVILTDGTDQIQKIVQKIVAQRERRGKSNSKRKFDGQTIRAVAERDGLSHGTLYDYQDVTFRYLKATGLFQSRGHGIALVPEHHKIATLLADKPEHQLQDVEYLELIANGAELPTDTQRGATEVLENLRKIAVERNIGFNLSEYDLNSPEGISLARHDLDQLIFNAKELEYAERQVHEIDEILAYLQLLDENRTHLNFGDDTLRIPKEERPAYFEWLLWRVLLALDDLVVPPSKVRRFNIDQDFLPVSTAPGGGADVIGEYADSVLVVEVTLTESSRQEAAEGEPVRRHVADALERFEPRGKTVYGLFVARRIDTNTAETFRIGVWYLKGDVRKSLDVVPLTLFQLRKVLEGAVSKQRLKPSALIDVIVECSAERADSCGAPAWKEKIVDLIGA